MEEIRSADSLASKLNSAKSRVNNAEANLNKTIHAKRTKASLDIKQKTEEIEQNLAKEIKGQEEIFIKELEEAIDPFLNELITQQNFFASKSMLNQREYDKFIELMELIKNSESYIVDRSSGNAGSNLIRSKWVKIKSTAQTLEKHFNNEEKFYGHGHKPNVEFADNNHVTVPR